MLTHADRVVPKLGWRKVDRLGNLDIKCPDIMQAFMSLHEAAIYSWVVPSEQFRNEYGDGDGDGEGDAETSRPRDASTPGAQDIEQSSTGSAGGPFYVARIGPTMGGAAAEDLPTPEPGIAVGAVVNGGPAHRTYVPSPVQRTSVSSVSVPSNTQFVSQAEALQRGASDKAGETGRDNVYADAEVTPSAVSSVVEHPAGSPEAHLSTDREGASRKRAEAEQVRSYVPAVSAVSPAFSRVVSPISCAESPHPNCGLAGASWWRSPGDGVSVIFSSPKPQHQRQELYIRNGVVWSQERQAHSLAARGQGLKHSGSRGFDPKFNLRLIEHATTAAAGREASVHPVISDQESEGGSDGGESVDVLEVTLQGEDPTTHVPLYKLTCRGSGGAPLEHPGDRRKERRIVEKALTTLRKVVAPLHIDGTPSSKHASTGVDLRRSRTVGSATTKSETKIKKAGGPAVLPTTKTGLGAYRPRRTGSGVDAGTPRQQVPTITINNNANTVAFEGDLPRGAAARDTGARRFDTDATLVFNDIPNGAWEGPRKQKRGVRRVGAPWITLHSGQCSPRMCLWDVELLGRLSDKAWGLVCGC